MKILGTAKFAWGAYRQSATAAANGFRVRWEVPHSKVQATAQGLLSKLGISNISVIVKPKETEKFMKTEEMLFDTFTEIVLLSELYERLSPEQILNTIEGISASFSELPPDVLARYKAYLRDSIAREKARGSTDRAAILEDMAHTFP